MFQQGSQAAALPPPMPADPYSISSAWSTGMPDYYIQQARQAGPVTSGVSAYGFSGMAHPAPNVSFGPTPVRGSRISTLLYCAQASADCLQ